MQYNLTNAIRSLKGQLDELLAARVLTDPGESFSGEIEKALRIQSGADDVVRAVVLQARDRGMTWQVIGDALGVSRQAAFQRYGKPIDPRTGAPINTTPLSDAAELVHAVIQDLVHARWESVVERFDPAMRENLSADALAAAWAQILGTSGDFEGHDDPTVTRAGNVTVTSTPLSMEAGDYSARIAFRDDRTIAGLHILTEPAP